MPQQDQGPETEVFYKCSKYKELENFKWDIGQYFRATHILDGEKVNITNMYMFGDAKLW